MTDNYFQWGEKGGPTLWTKHTDTNRTENKKMITQVNTVTVKQTNQKRAHKMTGVLNLTVFYICIFNQTRFSGINSCADKY